MGLARLGKNSPHGFDEVTGEERIQRCFVESQRSVPEELQVDESCSGQFLGEDTLRHRTGDSTRPSCIAGHHLRG